MAAPIHNIRASGIDVAIWENESGKYGVNYSVTIQRNYKTDDGYKSTGFLRKTDLLVASRLLEQAFDFIAGLKSGTKSTDTNDDF